VPSETSARPLIGDAEPHGYGNGHGNGSSDQHQLLHALHAVRLGDFSVRLPGDQTGLSGKIADTFNEIVAANSAPSILSAARISAETKWQGPA
jgi:hypothetical protein